VSNNDAVWKPHVTVAAVCQRDDRFLLVREKIEGQEVLNQPAGHLEPGETLHQAVVRETLEETAYDFLPTGIVGIYRYVIGTSNKTYLRFAFAGDVGHRHARDLDAGILGAEWLSLAEIEAERDRLRTPMVLQCILDYQANRAYPLQLISPEFA
jgi:8-oxo-dGTP pyrophosphatase MutT (NUDIX family)